MRSYASFQVRLKNLKLKKSLITCVWTSIIMEEGIIYLMNIRGFS